MDFDTVKQCEILGRFNLRLGDVMALKKIKNSPPKWTLAVKLG